MLKEQLKLAAQQLESLITLTNQDIEDIQQAKHEDIFLRMKEKNKLIDNFQNAKIGIEQGIIQERTLYPNKSTKEIMSGENEILIDKLRDHLKELKALNLYYSRSVFAVGEFYDSLLHQLLPVEKDGYNDKMRHDKPSIQNSFLHLGV